MIKLIKARLKGEEGQSMVEFALVVPIFLLLLLGVISFGQIFYSYLMIENASRDGARYGTVWASDTEIRQIVNEKTISLDATKLAIAITPTPDLRRRGERIEVRINYQVPLWAPIWNNLLPNPFPISTKTVMRIE